MMPCILSHLSPHSSLLHLVLESAYDCDGDIAAYWFSRVIAKGYRFEDPLPSKIERNEYYIHWENGITGHSAWADQGKGRNPYNADVYVDLLLKEFSYKY